MKEYWENLAGRNFQALVTKENYLIILAAQNKRIYKREVWDGIREIHPNLD